MSDERGRVPPLFWVNDAGSGLPVSVSLAEQRMICFFSLEIAAIEYAERRIGGEPGVDWYAVGSEDPDDLLRVADGASEQGFGGWVLDPPLDAPDEPRAHPWSEMREEVEHKLDVGAAWGSTPRSPSLRPEFDPADRGEDPDPPENDEPPEIPPDPETFALMRLSSPAVDILQGPSSPYEAPPWVEDAWRNPRRIELAERDGADALNERKKQTEERLAALLGRRPWGSLHLIGLLRRLPNDQFFLGDKQEEDGLSRFDPYQAEVTERAALKYGRWDDGGAEIDYWRTGLPGTAQDRPSVDAERVAELFALVRLAGLQLGYAERMRRALVRGQTVVVRPDGVSDPRPEPELGKRLALHDERTRRFSLVGATAGTFRPSDVSAEPGEKSAARAVRTTHREDQGADWWTYETSRRRIRKRYKNFVFSIVDLEPAYEYLKLLEDEVVAQYGLTPEATVAALSALDRMVVHFLAPDGIPEGLIPERLAFLDRRGYLLVREDVMDGVVLGRWVAEAHRRAFPDAVLDDPEGLVRGFKRLAYLDSYRREDLSLEDGKPWVRSPERDEPAPMPPPFVYPAGEHRVVDLGAVGNFVQGLVDCLRLEEAPRQRVSKSLEQRLGDYFARELGHPRAFEPSKKLYVEPPGGNRRLLTDLDVSVRVGSVLVAVDAKSLQVSPGYRRYEHADVRNRWQKFERYVDHADEQADKLARQPTGTNYDLLMNGYTHVVTLLCSTVPEYIDTDDGNFYLREDLPRVATPLELRDYLAEATEEDLKALPFAKRIGGE